jgi:hypothetical protein
MRGLNPHLLIQNQTLYQRADPLRVGSVRWDGQETESWVEGWEMTAETTKAAGAGGSLDEKDSAACC